MKSVISLTIHENQVHVSLKEHTFVNSLSSGFSYENSNLHWGETVIPCSAKEFNKLKKLYHKAMKPKRSPHLVWSLTTGYSLTVACCALLFLGLSQTPPIPLDANLPSGSTAVQITEPTTNTFQAQQHSTSSLVAEPKSEEDDFFPFPSG